jgi:DNA polymerase-3 subunit delta'
LPEPEITALLLEQGITSDPDEAARLGSLSEGSVGRALGLTDASLQEFRREMIDEVAGDHGFQAPELAHRLLAFSKQAGKESVDQRRRASLLIGELARFFRGVLWGTAGLTAPCPDSDDRRAAHNLASRLEPEDVLVLADRCIEADYQIQRKLYMPLILESLMHDLAKLINTRT